jgi:hypothetical protein
MKFLEQIGAYIAGGPPAQPKGGMPLRTTSRPLGGRDAPAGPRRDLFANKKFAKRPSGNLPPAGWAGGCLPPDQRAGGTHFSKCSPPAPLFPILLFYLFFFKKISIFRNIDRSPACGAHAPTPPTCVNVPYPPCTLRWT